jgi:hypothetical protein
MTKKDTPSLMDLVKVKAKNYRANKCWLSSLSPEEQSEIQEAAKKLKQEGIPFTCLAEVLIEKYKLTFSKESIVRTITRRAVR